MAARQSGFFYGWVVVAITFVTVLVAAGVRSAPAVFIHPLETEFGWNRAAIATAVSITLLMYGVAAPISGRLIDRFGPRWVMVGGFLLMALGIGGTLSMSALWQLHLLWGVLMGLGSGACASVLYASVASRWFATRRGLVLGLLGSAPSSGQLVFLPLLMAVIVAFGWRGGSLMVVGIILVLLLPILLWMRDNPSDVGQQPYGANTAAGMADARDNAPAMPLLRAFRTYDFWLLAGGYFICGVTSNGLIGTHLIPHAIDQGIPELTAAAVLGVMGGMNFIGTLGAGWLTDRYDPRKVLATVYGLRGLSLFTLPFVTDSSLLFVFAVVYGLDWFASVAPTIALSARCFGKASIGTVYGWIFLAHQLGGATAATLGGVARVAFGDYTLAFMIGGVTGLIAAGMVMLISVQKQKGPAALVPSPSAA